MRKIISYFAVPFSLLSIFASAKEPISCKFSSSPSPQINATAIEVEWGEYVKESAPFSDQQKATVWFLNEAQQKTESYDVIFNLSKTTTRCVYQDRATAQLNAVLTFELGWNSYDACHFGPDIEDYGFLRVTNADGTRTDDTCEPQIKDI